MKISFQQPPVCTAAICIVFYLLFCLLPRHATADAAAEEQATPNFSNPSHRTSSSLLFLNAECEQCSFFLFRQMKRGEGDQCRSRCVLFEGLARVQGWECGECEDDDAIQTEPPTTQEPTTQEPKNDDDDDDDDVYNITLNMADVPTQYQEVFENAKDRWEKVVVGGLPNITVNQFIEDQSLCPLLPDVIDDLFLCPWVGDFDGEGGLVGYGGPEWVRYEPSVTAAIGFIDIDGEVMDFLNSQGFLEHMVTQFMGQSIGFGLLWGFNRLLGSDFCSYDLDSKATSAFQDISECSYAVPLASPDEIGACSFWKEDCLPLDIMSPNITSSDEITISRVTVGSMEDMGMEVNYDAADPYDASDLGPACDCTRRVRRSVMGVEGESTTTASSSTSLSKERLDAATVFGKNHLKKMKERRGNNDAGREVRDGLMYVGDKAVAVYVMENDKVFTVVVESDE